MGLRRAKVFIEEARRAGILKIVFTGGEPLLHPRELRILVHCAAGKGMESALITNAAWVSSRAEAKAYLSDLKAGGLRSLTLSTDRYHLLRVPLKKLQTALEAATEVGLQAGVKIARLSHDPVAEGLYRSLRAISPRLIVQEISPLGRAADLRSRVKLRSPMSFTGPGCSTPPFLRPDGELLTCCNLPARDLSPTDTPFVLGNVETEPLPALLRKRSGDPLLHTLRSHGPGTLLTLLARSIPSFERWTRVPTHSRCDLCFHLFFRLQNKSRLYAALRKQVQTNPDGLGAFS